MKPAIGLAILGGAIAIFCARSGAQISTEEAQRRLAERQAERTAHPPATRPIETAATQPVVATRPVLTQSTDGLPFPPVTCDRAKAPGPSAHAKLSDIADLLLVPPGVSGVKLYGVDASADLLRRRLRDLSLPFGCQWFAIDLDSADLAGIEVDQGVIAKIILMYHDPRAAQQAVSRSYGQHPTASSSHVGPWSVSLILPGQHFPDRWPAMLVADVSLDLNPMKAAIAKHQLVIGMTLEQAQLSQGGKGAVVAQSERGIIYEWRQYYRVAAGTADLPRTVERLGAIVDAVFLNGKLVSFDAR